MSSEGNDAADRIGPGPTTRPFIASGGHGLHPTLPFFLVVALEAVVTTMVSARCRHPVPAGETLPPRLGQGARRARRLLGFALGAGWVPGQVAHIESVS
ncbi:hypothetical protein [Nocardiopsis ansamitocini]|nr:hypothetical protein [Nocardiopsis ansamitocini]